MNNLSNEQIIALLNEPLDQTRIRKKHDGSLYLEGFDIIDVANRIFGYDGWNYEITYGPETSKIGKVWTRDIQGGEKKLVDGWLSKAKVRITVKFENSEINREDIGINEPSISGKDINNYPTPSAIETSQKGAVTDAMKRAFRTLGRQFGNTLYDALSNDRNTQNNNKQFNNTKPVQTNQQNSKPDKICPGCGGTMRYKTGISKRSNKPYAGWFCDNQQQKNCKPEFED